MKIIINFLDRILSVLERKLIIIGGIVVVLLMFLGCAEVIGRSAFNAPIFGNIDIVEQLMVLVAVLGVSFCQSEFGNVRMTLLIHGAEGRKKWAFEIFALMISLFVLFVFVNGSWLNFQRSWNFGGDTPEINFPLWITVLTVTFSLALLFARLAVQLLEAIRMMFSPSDISNIFNRQSTDIDDFVERG